MAEKVLGDYLGRYEDFLMSAKDCEGCSVVIMVTSVSEVY